MPVTVSFLRYAICVKVANWLKEPEHNDFNVSLSPSGAADSLQEFVHHSVYGEAGCLLTRWEFYES